MRCLLHCMLASAWLYGLAAHAQDIFRADEHLAADRPEAWALNYFSASSLMTSFGTAPTPGAGHWSVALELGHIPRMSDAQQRVGFNGFKQEDLNKSPVFGRVRLGLGLPAGWLAEVGYTPPLSINGARPRHLFAIAIGRPLVVRDRYMLSARGFAQHGQVHGDITCPADLAGVEGDRNPFGCQAPSRDRVSLDNYGLELTAGWAAGPWRLHAGLGAARTESEVQVDAMTFDVRDRSRLTARDVLPFATLGTSRELGPRWRLAMELLYVPLTVRRNEQLESDPLLSLRVQLRYDSD